MRAALLAAAYCGLSSGAVNEKLIMFYETGPEGSGPMPSSLSLAAQKQGGPTATVAQYLNDPIGVLAFSAVGGANSPTWSYYPESVDMDIAWELVGTPSPVPSGGVDTVVMQYSNELFTKENINCTLWGVSTGPTASDFKPLWTAQVPHCGPSLQPAYDAYGQWRSLAITADASTLVASLALNGASQVLMAWNLSTGKQLFSVPTPGGSFGVALSGDSQWALVNSDDYAFVYSTATGKQRGTTGCRTPWNIPPTLSQDGGYIVSGDQNGMRVCVWDKQTLSYDTNKYVDIPSRGQTYWFPVDMSVMTVGTSTFAAGTFVGTTASDVGRIYGVDLEAVAAGSLNYIVLDALLDNNLSKETNAFALLRKAGSFWVVGTAGGTANATAPTEYLFAPGTTDAPSLDSPLWKFTGGGGVNNLDAALVASGPGTATVQVLCGGPGNIGTSGNGGQVYWHELVITQ